MGWFLPLRHFHGGQKCILPLTYLEMLKDRGYIFPLGLELLGPGLLLPAQTGVPWSQVVSPSY